eukprot:4003519-Prymnesium_polylepis.2
MQPATAAAKAALHERERAACAARGECYDPVRASVRTDRSSITTRNRESELTRPLEIERA